MDNETLGYRVKELSKVVINCSDDMKYPPKIKFSTATGETKHLDITWDELYQIKDILTKTK